ncbi:hypothetical protein Axy20_003 [Achromobacter phage vB_AxyS_19-32_Axy20]|nr:hypothetical protein Axy18_003 [Achromobacter phage vB_AxyS_19-32_Axy18]QDH84494.1 hypothetical protein Axy20_003 [Achromobacter phage vB_AxyS_19-32_Axy20]
MSNNMETQQFPGGFDTQAHGVFGGRGSFIAGPVEIEITESMLKNMANGNGGKLELVVKAVSGENLGRETWWNIPVYHTDPETAARGKKQLSTICAAIGLTGTLTHTTQLHGHRFWVLAELEKDAEKAAKGYTTITRVLLNGADGAANPGQPAKPAPAAAASGWGAPAPQQQPQQQATQQQQQQQQQQAPAQVPQQAPVQAAPQAQAPVQWGAPAGGQPAGTPTWGA